jgi:hypothetical protein
MSGGHGVVRERGLRAVHIVHTIVACKLHFYENLPRYTFQPEAGAHGALSAR